MQTQNRLKFVLAGSLGLSLAACAAGSMKSASGTAKSAQNQDANLLAPGANPSPTSSPGAPGVPSPTIAPAPGAIPPTNATLEPLLSQFPANDQISSTYYQAYVAAQQALQAAQAQLPVAPDGCSPPPVSILEPFAPGVPVPATAPAPAPPPPTAACQAFLNAQQAVYTAQEVLASATAASEATKAARDYIAEQGSAAAALATVTQALNNVKASAPSPGATNIGISGFVADSNVTYYQTIVDLLAAFAAQASGQPESATKIADAVTDFGGDFEAMPSCLPTIDQLLSSTQACPAG